jgi:hypothetical protein
VQIFDFIKTGEIGLISLGMEIGHIKSILGEPDDIARLKKTSILKYGSMQLYFHAGGVKDSAVLQSIYLYFDDEQFKLPNKLNITGWIPNKDTSVKELIEHLETQGIYLEKDNKHTINDQVGYKSSANVVIIFSLDGSSEKLSKIGKWA